VETDALISQSVAAGYMSEAWQRCQLQLRSTGLHNNPTVGRQLGAHKAHQALLLIINITMCNAERERVYNSPDTSMCNAAYLTTYWGREMRALQHCYKSCRLHFHHQLQVTSSS
jgi:hypothetical protein